MVHWLTSIRNYPKAMILFYNILQLLLFPLLLIILCIPRYRRQNLRRLGFGIKRKPRQIGRKVIWIHALSVGEVTSSLPLISGIRQQFPEAELFLSTASRDGEEAARKLFGDIVDGFITFPLDIRFVINRFLRIIEPDLFIVVQTDIWPNFQSCLLGKKVPSILVNGRISLQSYKLYKRLSFLFKPLFASFTTLCVQTEKDQKNLIKLGISEDKIHVSGNLKFDTGLYSTSDRNQPISFILPEHKQLIVAGSSHTGEEAIILQSYKELKTEFPDIYLIIAPRHVNESPAIHKLAQDMGLGANRRSQINAGGRDLFILDTIGELNSVYSHAAIAFVGGSLIKQRGHNPIEPAIFSVPVLFGHHMENFFEICDELLQARAALMIRNQAELTANLKTLLQDPEEANRQGTNGANYISTKQGVVARLLPLLNELL